MKDKGVITKISYEIDKRHNIVKVWYSILNHTDYFELPREEVTTEDDIFNFIDQAYSTLGYGDDE